MLNTVGWCSLMTWYNTWGTAVGTWGVFGLAGEADWATASTKDMSSIVTVGGRLGGSSVSMPSSNSVLLLLAKARPGLRTTVSITMVSVGNVEDVEP